LMYWQNMEFMQQEWKMPQVFRKIASLGLRVQRGCTYHGISLNVDMDLAPFDRIVPCGLAGMKMTDMKSLGMAADIELIGRQFIQVFSITMGYTPALENHRNNLI
jgi:lipoate-protein ligase B